MLKHPTLDQLHALGLHGMAKAFAEIAAGGEADGLGHHEWLGLLLDHEASWRQDKRLAARLRVAKLRQQACVEDVDYRNPRPQRRPSFLLALGRQCPRFRRSARSARSHTANLLAQRAIRLFTPARTPTLQGKAIGSAVSLQRPRHSRRGQIPIAPAAPSVPHTPRFRALALFGRWPPQRVDGLGIPASENLHIIGHQRDQCRCLTPAFVLRATPVASSARQAPTQRRVGRNNG